MIWSICYSTFSQREEDSIKMAVNKLFTAMKSSDAVALKECFTDSSIMQTIIYDKENKLLVKNESIYAFIETISHLPKDAADERIVFDIIKIDSQLANVWAPYQFYYNKQFTHCGIDNFVLVKSSGKWKIQYLIDTRRKDGCMVN
jgi:hypothetical protein